MPQPECDEMITDFTVEIKTENGYERLADVSNNFQRLVCIDCNGIISDEVKITAIKCHKSDFAKITEVRIY